MHGLGGVVTFLEQVAYTLDPPRSGGTVAGGIQTAAPARVASPAAGTPTASTPTAPTAPDSRLF